MIRNYFKLIIRGIKKSPGQTFINIFGLSLGITCSIVLFSLMSYFKSFDQFNENADHIYRVVTSVNESNGTRSYGAGIPVPLPDAFRERYAEMQSSVFIQALTSKSLIGVENIHGELKYYETQGDAAFVEPSYFDVFTRPISRGDQYNSLKEPNQVVISQTLAKNYFGDRDPLGQILTLDKDVNLTVTAIVEDHPMNTAFPFDMLISYATIKKEQLDYGWNNFYGEYQFYLVAEDERVLNNIKVDLPQFTNEIYGENTYDRAFHIQSMEEIHTDRRFGNYGPFVVGKGEFLSMILISVFMIVTACINFINLSTAVSVKRSREVGIRKVLGGQRIQLIFQFLSETLAIVFLSILASVGFAEVLIMFLNPYLNIDIQLSLLTSYDLQIYLVSVLLSITLVAGIYPAFVLSGYQPIKTLKNLINYQNSGGFSLRRILVVFQLFMSQAYIIGTIILLAQLNYMREADPGFKTSGILTVPLAEDDLNKAKMLKGELQSLSFVEQVSLAGSMPSSLSKSSTSINIAGYEESFKTNMKFIDHNYVDIFEIPLITGSNIDDTDSVSGVMVNEEWVEMVGLADAREAVGLMVKVWGVNVPVTGVIKNFHTSSMAKRIEPLILIGYPAYSSLSAVKINSANLKTTLASIESKWQQVYPEYQFEYHFVDDQLARMYVKEEKMFGMLSSFSLMTILISCMGLFGLASFMVNRKIKEIGVRKVMGASVRQVISIFTKEYFRLILIAFLLAGPMIWYGMNLWLQNFEYRIDINPFMVASGLLIITTISLLTVTLPTWKAASINPAKSLRSE